MWSNLLKYKSFLFAGITLVLAYLVFSNFFSPSIDQEYDRFQKLFSHKEQSLSTSLDQFASTISENDSLASSWDKTRQFRRSEFNYYIFSHDTLLYWTSNHAPIRFKELSLTPKTVVLLENGWYFIDQRVKGSLTIVGLFLIKNEFPYQNESLINRFAPDFEFPLHAEIRQIPDKYDIHSSKGTFLFSLSEIQELPKSENIQLAVFGLFVLGVFLLLISVLNYSYWPKNTITWSISLLSIIVLVLLRWISIQQNWLVVFEDFELFNPQVFASSVWLPTLGDYVLNVLLFLAIVLTIQKKWRLDITVFNQLQRKSIGLFAFLCFFALSFVFSNTSYQLVRDSDIPLAFHQFMDLNVYSFVFIVVFGLALWGYFILSSLLLQVFSKSGFKPSIMGVIWFMGGLCYFVFELVLGQLFFVVTILPLILSGVLMLIQPWKKQRINFTQAIVLLILFAGHTSIQLYTTLEVKEKEKREVYAKKLISDKDLNTEIEYSQLSPVLSKHPLLVDAFENPDNVIVSDLKKSLEKRFFTNYWNRFEVDFFLFTPDSIPVGSYAVLQENSFSRYDDVIRKHAEVSDISSHIYYVTDYTYKLSYIVKQPILSADNSLIGYLFCTLKSKTIPQEIGFPRLLLSEESKVFFPLEEYSMGKYIDGKLVSRFGAYNYPLTTSALLSDFNSNEGFLKTRRTDHYILNGDYNRTLVLSKGAISFQEKLTSFSLLFSIFGFLLLLSLLFSGKLIPDWSRIKLAFKIQLMLIALVFFSLLFLSIGTGSFVKEQYNEYREGLIREKLSSVNMELIQKLGYETHIKRAKMGNYLEYLLQKFSTVFMTDINLYDLNGGLLASSRPEIYNLGLISEQINPRAYRNISFKKKSVYIHEETIGLLNYLSAYIPLQNNYDEVIAYINLPYFAKQNEFENEIAGFLSAIINIFVLLLALSIVVAVFVTNRITEPLKLIQNSLAELKLGKANTPISYRGNDEIGALVEEYNKKLNELQENTVLLAKTEREVAWREMAKQVAHEIKNPLTPMKLRLQHLQRSFDPSDPDSQERLNHVAQSIIEQIDALTVIANEFSNFAKLPKPKEEKININAIIRSVAETFSETLNTQIVTVFDQEEIVVFADKDLMIRLFNNLVKNAAQSIPEGQHGHIEIRVHTHNGKVTIAIQDNGSGIPSDMKEKIFAPNFTTKSTGMGLGLAMVKQIIESHKGSIYFESSSEGTTFYIELDLVD